jgi:hypothetical protein
MTAQGDQGMNVTVKQRQSGCWQAWIAVTTPTGARYFSESGDSRTAALLSLRRALRPYRGDGYDEARAAILEQALA